MSHANSYTRNIIIWFLVIACFLSIGSGSARAVICLEQNGEATLELGPKNRPHRCIDNHLHRAKQAGHTVRTKTLNTTMSSCNTRATCKDFEVSFQLFAQRNETINHLITFIADPQLTTGQLKEPVVKLSNTFSTISYNPATIDPALTHLQSIVLLI